MFKYAKKGLTPSQIGVVLRDSFGIPQARTQSSDSGGGGGGDDGRVQRRRRAQRRGRCEFCLRIAAAHAIAWLGLRVRACVSTLSR